MADSDSDKREYQRYEVHYDAVVHDQSGSQLLERMHLKNVSGGGVCLLSHHPERYSLNQIITVSIMLPPTEQMTACLKGVGKVVRIGDEDAKSGTSPIGVLVIKPFLFDESSPAPAAGNGR